MHSSYQNHASHFANISLASAHAIVNDLHARARKLAPRFAEESIEAGCSNLRPTDAHPRQQRAWEMLAEALAWNVIADDHDAVVAAKVAEANEVAYMVGFAWNVTPGERVSYQQPFVVELGDHDFLNGSQLMDLEKTVARGTSVVFLGAR